MTVPQTPTTIVGIVENKIEKGNMDFRGNKVGDWCLSTWKAIISEFIATGVLVLLGCMTCIPIPDIPYQSSIYTPLGFGFIVSLNIQIFGHISGAHMNPSVSVAAMLWGLIPIKTGICYIMAQILGAILGFGLLTTISPVDMSENGLCVTVPQEALNVGQILGIEIVLTSVLNFLNCGVWDPVNKHKQDSVPLKFGLAIVGLSLAGGPLTGASMNPARSLGPAVWTGLWTMHWVYWVGPIIGGILPVLIYKFVLLKKVKEGETQ